MAEYFPTPGIATFRKHSRASNPTADKLLFFVVSCLYLLALNYVYVTQISVKYAYYGMISNSLTYANWLFLLAYLVIAVVLSPIRLNRPSNAIAFLLYFQVVVPLPLFAFQLGASQAVWMSLLVLLNYAILVWLLNRDPIVLPQYIEGQRLALLLLMGIGVSVLFLRVYLFEYFELNLDIHDVYERRLAGRDAVAVRTLPSYILAIGTSAVGLVLIGVGVLWKRHYLWILGCMIYLFSYATIGSKGDLFRPLLFLTALWLISRYYRDALKLMMFSLLVLCVASVAEFVYWKGDFLGGLVVRRQLVVPAALTVSYVEFFTFNKYYLYSDNVLRWFLSSPYSVNKSMLIGQLIGNSNTNANANVWASGYADFGFFGMVIATTAVSVIGRILDGMATRLGPVLCAIAAIGIGLKLGQAPIERCLISHGVIAILVLLYLLQPTRGIAGGQATVS